MIAIAVATLLAQATLAQKFDPYQLNGGLVAAVAGKDYVLIASDTRLTDGGYGINSRRYLSGRLWSASSSSTASAPFPLAPSSSSGGSDEDAMTSSAHQPSTTSTSSTWKRFPAQWESDGSLIMPPSDSLDSGLEVPAIQQKGSGSTMITSTPTFDTHTQTTSHLTNNLPIMIGSAGCASDCESLKRRVRLELDALEFSFPNNNIGSNNNNKMGVKSVANLLQQILYGRRGFPFYSFCVVAGIDLDGSHNIDEVERGCGAVYVYDAIGSYERVAVASAGTGRELLQPILDRLFSSSGSTSSQRNSNNAADKQNIDDGSQVRRDFMAVPAGKQRMGVAGSLRPPVQTTVNCSWEEAVHNVAKAYQSVAEREISVGDEIVICVVNKPGAANSIDSGNAVTVFSYPLKKH